MKKASKLLYIIGGVFCLMSVVSVLASVAFMWLGGFVPGLVLGILSLAYNEAYYFLAIGLPIMGGLWISAFALLPTIVLPLVSLVLALIAGFKRKGSGKVLAIINLILAILLLLNGDVIPGILILLASVFVIGRLSEEKEIAEQQEAIETAVEEIAK